jgi:type III secretory pathway component EscS
MQRLGAAGEVVGEFIPELTRMIGELTAYSLKLILLISATPLLAGAALAMLCSFFLAAIQVQEQTTVFLLRLAGTCLVLWCASAWISDQLMFLFHRAFETILLLGVR